MNSQQTIPRGITKFALLLLLSSITLPAAAFATSDRTGRTHSHPSYHAESHRSGRATSSSIVRNSQRMIIRVVAGKGGKDRDLPLSPALL